jgi:hypothetical protein
MVFELFNFPRFRRVHKVQLMKGELDAGIRRGSIYLCQEVLFVCIGIFYGKQRIERIVQPLHCISIWQV